CRQCMSGNREGLALDSIDTRAAAQGWKGQADTIFRQAVDRHHAFTTKAVAGKVLAELLSGLGIHGFGAVEGTAPAAQIQFSELFVTHSPQAELVGEVGCRRQGATVAVDCAQPAYRPGDEGQR